MKISTLPVAAALLLALSVSASAQERGSMFGRDADSKGKSLAIEPSGGLTEAAADAEEKTTQAWFGNPYRSYYGGAYSGCQNGACGHYGCAAGQCGTLGCINGSCASYAPNPCATGNCYSQPVRYQPAPTPGYYGYSSGRPSYYSPQNFTAPQPVSAPNYYAPQQMYPQPIGYAPAAAPVTTPVNYTAPNTYTTPVNYTAPVNYSAPNGYVAPVSQTAPAGSPFYP